MSINQNPIKFFVLISEFYEKFMVLPALFDY